MAVGSARLTPACPQAESHHVPHLFFWLLLRLICKISRLLAKKSLSFPLLLLVFISSLTKDNIVTYGPGPIIKSHFSLKMHFMLVYPHS